MQETFAKQLMEQLQAVELPSGRVWIQLVIFTFNHHVVISSCFNMIYLVLSTDQGAPVAAWYNNKYPNL